MVLVSSRLKRILVFTGGVKRKLQFSSRNFHKHHQVKHKPYLKAFYVNEFVIEFQKGN